MNGEQALIKGRSFESSRIVSETRLIPADTPGVRLQLINKHRDDLGRFTSGRTLVIMHGATFPSASLFDVEVGGASVMDLLAAAGYDVWAVDVRGYGGSSRGPEMELASEDAAPLTPARTAVDDFGTALDFVCRHRGLSRACILGMSWGATVVGAFACRVRDRVEKLVLVAPLWLSKTPLRVDPGGPIGSYRLVDPRAYEVAWRGAAPDHERQWLIPEGWFEAWVEATLATDVRSPVAGKIRAPNGAIQDVRDHWTAARPLYDPAEIGCPVLVLSAEWDVDANTDMTHGLFTRLTAVSYKRFIQIGQGTHMVLMERNRQQAINEIIGFLDERFTPAL